MPPPGGVNTLRVNVLEGSIPDVLNGPQAAHKEAHPPQGFVLGQIGIGLTHAFLPDARQNRVLQHNNHQESIEKNHEGKNKIELFRCHIQFIGALPESKSPVRLTIQKDMIEWFTEGFDGVKLYRK